MTQEQLLEYGAWSGEAEKELFSSTGSWKVNVFTQSSTSRWELLGTGLSRIVTKVSSF